MSDPESFLSRWSRLKQESNTVARPEPGPASVAEPAGAVAVGAADAAVESTRGEVEPALAPPFDPASLPPVASITQASDIRQFLQAGVPAELVRAALRAAWATDPAIRDFIGIADSQWDFNDPTAMPGFGPLEAADGARAFAQRSVARVNEAAEAVARMPELATRAAVDAANLPREGQVDRVWLSAGSGGSRVGSASLPSRTPQSVTAPNPDAEADPSRERAGAADSSEQRPGRPERHREMTAAANGVAHSQPRVHGTALPKART